MKDDQIHFPSRQFFFINFKKLFHPGLVHVLISEKREEFLYLEILETHEATREVTEYNQKQDRDDELEGNQRQYFNIEFIN
jgi:hypothetical protein